MKKVLIVVGIVVGVMLICCLCWSTSAASQSDSDDKTSTADSQSKGSDKTGVFPNTASSSSQPLNEAEITAMFTNADDFKNRSVEKLPGLVFNVIMQTQGDYEYQCWADANLNNQFLVVSDTDLGIRVDDYVLVDGTVVGQEEMQLRLTGAMVPVAIIMATNATVADASIFNLAQESLAVNQTVEQQGIAVTLQHVELAQNSTGVFLKIYNGSCDKIGVYGFNSYIKQGTTQFDQSDISYEEDTIQTDLNVGIESEGCLSFQALRSFDEPFMVSIYIMSDDWDIDLAPFEFSVAR